MVAATVAAVGLGALLALRPAGDEADGADEAALLHARSACDLTAKAGEASGVETRARYAAATLLLDRAIIESGRAASAAEEFIDLDTAVRAVHTAAHRGKPEPWREALDTALVACRDTAGSAGS